MSQPEGLFQWSEEVSRQMPHLSKPQVKVLAWYSFAVALLNKCGLSVVAAFLGLLLAKEEQTVRQQLREWLWDAPDKAGKQRQEVDVTVCFGPLVRWVLSYWPHGEKRVALAMDATHFKQTFILLVVSIVYRGCAIPVAWVALPALDKASWQPHWIGLLDCLRTALPVDWDVIVLADRGLYAKWLFEHIVGCGWHPFLRITHSQGLVQPEGETEFRPLSSLVTAHDQTWQGKATCFKSDPLFCTLLACWETGYTDPWLIVTDLDPAHATCAWYGMRSWIEACFKDLKRGGFNWHTTRMTDPARAERLWLVLAVALLRLVHLGSFDDAPYSPASFPDCFASLTPALLAPPRQPRASLPLSLVTRGWLRLLVACLRNFPLPLDPLPPQRWPYPSPLPPPP
jgi:hypothetical protein